MKKCFIITPIGNENSDVFRKAKGVIESSIKPVLGKYGFDDVKPAYEINTSGLINTQIINRIIEDDLVIVNLTGNNPNVMYELCLRHVVAKPIIHICERGTNLPFDIKDNRTIFYENDMLGVEELKLQLSNFVDEIHWDEDYLDNPIYSAYKYGKLLKETQGTENNEILKMLIDIKERVCNIQGESHKEFIVRFPDYEEKEYTLKQLNEDIKKINKEKVNKILNNLQNSDGHVRLRVHELAKELHTKSQTLLCIAEILGLHITYAASSVKLNDEKAILEYIVENA